MCVCVWDRVSITSLTLYFRRIPCILSIINLVSNLRAVKVFAVEGATVDIVIITLSTPNFYTGSLALTPLRSSPSDLLFMKTMKTLSEDVKFNSSFCRRALAQLRMYVLSWPLTLDRYSKHALRRRNTNGQIASERSMRKNSIIFSKRSAHTYTYDALYTRSASEHQTISPYLADLGGAIMTCVFSRVPRHSEAVATL